MQWRELVDKECFRASLCSDTSYLNALAGWWIRAKAGPMTIDMRWWNHEAAGAAVPVAENNRT